MTKKSWSKSKRDFGGSKNLPCLECIGTFVGERRLLDRYQVHDEAIILIRGVIL
jgi:hypothetical protein